MAISLEQFVENLTRSGLLSADELEAFQQRLPPERRPKDAQGLARELIQANRLTRYQAAAVYQGKTKGLVFGEYTVLDQIGAGGMGQVLKARHRTMERIVALKVLPRRAMKLPEAVQRFQREVRAAARLQHANIVTAFDAGEADGIHFLVMEYVDGKDLAQLVAERGPLPVEEAVGYVVQAARGLEYAHSGGVVHRDIKPSNLLVDKRGNVKILDMGLARVFEGDETGVDRLTSTGQVMGTCDYMAPEQAEDTHRADHRADVYSLGCTFYRLLTGSKPYNGETLIQVLLAHREAPIPSLCDARPDVPAELDAVCRKMLAKTPEARYQSMTGVIGALDSCVGRREPAARTAAAEASGDGALTSFLQHLSQQEVAPVPPPVPAAEPTLRSQVERGTKPSVWKKLIPPNGSPAKLFLGIAGGVVALVVVVALLFLVLGHGGEDREHSPDIEAAAGPAEGADEQAERAKGEPPSDTGPPSPDDALLPTAELPAIGSASATLRATLDDFAGPVSSLAFGPNGRKLTSNGNGRGMLAVWDVLAGERVQFKRAHNENVRCVAFADNANEVAAGTYQRATVWTLDSENMRHTYGGQQSTIHAVAFAPGSTLLATASSDRSVWLWNVGTATTRWRKPNFGAYDTLCFSPNGSTLAAAGTDGTVYLLDVSSDDEVGRLVGHEDRTVAVDFSGDGRTIASGAHDKTVRLWNTADRQQRLALDHPDKVHSVSFTPDGGVVASACEDGKVRLWSTRSGELLATLADQRGPVRCVAFAPAGGILASGGDDKTIRVWEVQFRTTADVGADAPPPVEASAEEGAPQREPSPEPQTTADDSRAKTPAPTLPTSQPDPEGTPPELAVAARPSGGGPQLVRLDELNTAGRDNAFPWPSADGMTIYWTREGGSSRESGIWQATRKSVNSKFENLRRILPGRHAAFSDDGLHVVLLGKMDPSSVPLLSAARSSIDRPFSEPQVIAELSAEPTPKSPWLSGDGRVLVYQRGTSDGRTEFALVTRRSRSGRWSTPQVLPLSPDARFTALLTWPHLSADGLTLWFCHGGSKEQCDVVRASRKTTDEPFGDYQFLQVDGKPVAGKSPRYVAATRELLFSPVRSRVEGGWELWVVKNVDFGPKPPAESQRGRKPTSRKDAAEPPDSAVAPFNATRAKRYQRDWARYLDMPLETTNSLGMKLVLIPPGEFDMGKPGEEPTSAHFLHRVRLSRPFLIGKHEVRVGDFGRFVADTGYKTDVERGPGRLWDLTKLGWLDASGHTWRDPAYPQQDDHPVTLVSWNDATAFCDWLSGKEGKTYRLPTEAEWEYSYRAGTTTPFCCGDDPYQLCRMANIADQALKRSYPTAPRTGPWNDGHVFTAPVGSGASNAFGVHDMAGNLYEWCHDWYHARHYRDSPPVDPQGPETGKTKLIRGGGWNCSPDLCTAFSRNGLHPPDYCGNTGGFRVVCEIAESAQ